MRPRSQLLAFIAVMLTVFGGMHYYLYARLRSALAPCSGPELWALRALMVCGAISFPLLRILSRTSVWRAAASVYRVVVVWLGFVLYAFLSALALQGLAAILQVAGLGLPNAILLGFSPAHAAVALVAATAAVLVGIGFAKAQAMPRITDVGIALAHLPPALDGFCLVQLSDVHLGPFTSERRLRRIVERVNTLAPDLVVITGDLADEKPAHLAEAMLLLGHVRARHGVLAVPGNHDFFAGIDVGGRGAGSIHFLRNERVTVAGAIDVYGIDDDPAAARTRGSRTPRFEEVIGPEVRQRASIVLFHQPLGYPRLAEMGVGLVLSGHTHGGQLWPVSWLGRWLYPYNAGHYQIGESHFYVSRGTGTWGPPMRLGVPPEIVRLHLRSTA
jgi:predicted MPP superfamily phosphohydrolase